MNFYNEAIQRFQRLLKRAAKQKLNEPTAVVLSTLDRQGNPSSRTVLLKEVDPDGFVFYTNKKSRKGVQIEQNSKAALCFFCDPLMEQVTVEGKVEEVSAKEADAYWTTRPRKSQIGAWVSDQSRPLKSRKLLLQRVAKFLLKYAGKKIPRPDYWTGFRLIPRRIEFWKSGKFRLNERLLYEKKKGRWTKGLLYP